MRENLAITHRVHPAVPHHLVALPALIRTVAVKIYQLEADQVIAAALLATSAQVVKSAIHAGFVQLHKIVINRVSVHASSNQMFQMMSPAKS
jgi:hypothetical protein